MTSRIVIVAFTLLWQWTTLLLEFPHWIPWLPLLVCSRNSALRNKLLLFVEVITNFCWFFFFLYLKRRLTFRGFPLLVIPSTHTAVITAKTSWNIRWNGGGRVHSYIITNAFYSLLNLIKKFVETIDKLSIIIITFWERTLSRSHSS